MAMARSERAIEMDERLQYKHRRINECCGQMEERRMKVPGVSAGAGAVSAGGLEGVVSQSVKLLGPGAAV